MEIGFECALFLRLGRTVRADGRVQAIICDQKALYRLAIDDVGLDDFVDIGRGYAAVPDGVGIDDNRRAMLALIEASRHVGAHALLQSAQGQLLFELKLQLGLCLGIAAAARMARIPLVAADEQVPFKLRHNFNVQDFVFRGSQRFLNFEHLRDKLGAIVLGLLTQEPSSQEMSAPRMR
jgi:hypothetical protein